MSEQPAAPWLFCACGAYALDEDEKHPWERGRDADIHEPDMCWRPCRGECGNRVLVDGLCQQTHPLDGRIIAKRAFEYGAGSLA